MKLSLAMLSLAVAASAFAAPPSASEIVRQAQAEARNAHKNVLVYFHASWCPWCRRTETLLADPTFGPKFRDSYVLAPIDIRERDELRKKDENPGWEAEMRRLRGAPERDVPYLVILSSDGAKLGDSYRPPIGKIPGNAGFPRTPEEIEGFLVLLRRTAPSFSAEDRVALKDYFQNPPHPSR